MEELSGIMWLRNYRILLWVLRCLEESHVPFLGMM
jgi:hypothetical protein